MNQQWCERHWAVVQGDPTISGVVASRKLTDRFVSSHEFAQLGKLWVERGAEGLNEELERCSPLCCWVGDDTMNKIYDQARDILPAPRGTL